MYGFIAFSSGTSAVSGVSNLLRHACAKGKKLMSFSTGGRGPFQGQMNITPLIDVLLVLIIVFMVVVPMTQDKGLKTQIPQSADSKTSPPKIDPTIVVQVVWTVRTRRRSCVLIRTMSVGRICGLS